jgi:hypothetical protein
VTPSAAPAQWLEELLKLQTASPTDDAFSCWLAVYQNIAADVATAASTGSPTHELNVTFLYYFARHYIMFRKHLEDGRALADCVPRRWRQALTAYCIPRLGQQRSLMLAWFTFAHISEDLPIATALTNIGADEFFGVIDSIMKGLEHHQCIGQGGTATHVASFILKQVVPRLPANTGDCIQYLRTIAWQDAQDYKRFLPGTTALGATAPVRV